jgi:hypothetical protein
VTEVARNLASALEARGWSVWWDRKIVAGETYDQTIERHLESAKSVVVLWSKDSVASEWVKNEATAASERGVLVPALIDEVKLPLEFRRRQTANLIDWDGDTTQEGFEALCEGIAAKASAPAVAPRPARRSSHAQEPGFTRRRGWIAAAIAVAIATIGFVAYRARVPAPQENEISSAGETVGRAVVNSPVSGPAMTVSQPAGAVSIPRSETHGIDNPVPLESGVPTKVTLDTNDEYYFRLSSPASDFRIVLDTRRADNKQSNLQSRLSVLDEDGGVVEDGVLRFNEIDVGFRKTASFSSKQAARFGFKLLNTSGTADFWLIVSREPAPRFTPFFGELVPESVSPGEDAKGVLDTNEYVYYVTRLPRGDHRVMLDFATSKRQHTNIQGELSLLDADGGNQRPLVRFNEVDVSYRKIETFSVKTDEPLIVKIRNTSGSLNYTMRIGLPPKT